MQPGALEVLLDVTGKPEPLGKLWLHTRGKSTSFQYADSGLRYLHGFAIDPDLPLWAGAQNSSRRLPVPASRR